MNRQNQGLMKLGGFIDELLSNNSPRIFGENFFSPEWKEFKNSTPVNISESDQNFMIEVIAPGLSKDDIQISMEDNTLSISYEKETRNKSEEKDDENKQVRFLKNEYSYESFKRSFRLNDKIDADKIAAKYENGVLKIDLPKKELAIAKNRAITIE